MSRIRMAAAVGMLALTACGVLACGDGLFAPGAPHTRPATLAVAAVQADTALTAEFDRTDAIRVRVTREVGSLDTTMAFRSAGAETRVRVALELPDEQENVAIQIDLNIDGSPHFRGSASATLRRGEMTPVAIDVTQVPR